MQNANTRFSNIPEKYMQEFQRILNNPKSRLSDIYEFSEKVGLDFDLVFKESSEC